MKYFCRVFILCVILLFFVGCGASDSQEKRSSDVSERQPITVKDLAFNNGRLQGHRIYLKEDDQLVPFLVLTDDYDGNCLLLREFLLEDSVLYNSSGEYGSYYKDSEVDKFLNATYFNRLSEYTRQRIVSSKIEITTKNAIDTHVEETEVITRKLFLLSANEVNAGLGYVALKEGIPLSYFEKVENRIATYDNLEEGTWMLRTPALYDGSTTIGVACDGSVGMSGIGSTTRGLFSAVRPAFCIPSDTQITLREDGEDIYYIE